VVRPPRAQPQRSRGGGTGDGRGREARRALRVWAVQNLGPGAALVGGQPAVERPATDRNEKKATGPRLKRYLNE
jgi:hypothetical protein